ncbi:unnamed protein product [Urochloa decumbens]|uniref:F-box domain-containing protein n=1 Tax=Urochloa decumbens TaxID=240449 RepID=A0ABC9FLP1_9POAL
MAMATLLTELLEEILLRLPPSDPACLFRAALVCKRWCGIVSSAGFRRRFIKFHGTPPTVAAVYNIVDGDDYVACFRPCSASFPHHADRHGKAVLDCRHGRVLLRGMPAAGENLKLGYVSAIDVWDPITDKQWEVPLPFLYPYKFDPVVLCGAAAGTCDHLDCHGEPFLVSIVGTDLKDIFIYTYSSEDAAWSEPSSIHLDAALSSYSMPRPGLVTGDAIYFTLVEEGHRNRIVKYDMGSRVISMIDPPLSLHTGVKLTLVETKDGGLGVACNFQGYDNLHVWSRRVLGSNGVEQWVKDQVIKLDTVLSLSVATGGPSTKCNVVGFGEGTNVIFGSASDGLFVVWRNSGRVMKADERKAVRILPLKSMFCYQSFYTPAQGAFLNGEGPEASVSSA